LPKSKSAEKAARASERKRQRNKSVRSATKTHVARAEQLISGKELEPAQEAVAAAISAIDRAAKKGVIHTNTAARRKSRLMRKFNQAKLSGTAKKKTTGAGTA
jgi:small subunit ribosomal protein S20